MIMSFTALVVLEVLGLLADRPIPPPRVTGLTDQRTPFSEGGRMPMMDLMTETTEFARTTGGSTGADQTIYIGRQPIFDRQRKTVAYQLMHRGTSDAPAPAGLAPSEATTQQLVEHTLLQWGVDKLLNGKPGYVHVDSVFLAKGLHLTLPQHQVMLEIRGDIDPDGILFVHALDAKAAGYRMALCHLPDRQHHTAVDLLSLADVVKVDVGEVPEDQLEKTVKALRIQAPFAQLMAERVEELHQYRNAMALGFDLFEGFFFAQPEVLSKSARTVSSTAAIALLAEVQSPDVSIKRLEQLVVADPTLAFRLLRLVNSSMNGIATRVESVYHALVLLGIERVRQLVTLLTMASRSKENDEIITLAAIRAWMARATVDVPDLQDGAYTAGLLSVLDVVFRIPMAELVEDLPLAPSVAEALVDGTGPLGAVLDAVRAYERADLHALERLRPGELARYLQVYRDAAAWAQELHSQLNAG
jgi:EAL and modified HD-GYP domain-containing signal transduction protein